MEHTSRSPSHYLSILIFKAKKYGKFYNVTHRFVLCSGQGYGPYKTTKLLFTQQMRHMHNLVRKMVCHLPTILIALVISGSTPCYEHKCRAICNDKSHVVIARAPSINNKNSTHAMYLVYSPGVIEQIMVRCIIYYVV